MTDERIDDGFDNDPDDEVLPDYRIWQLTDSLSNGRWLFVNHPSPKWRYVSVGIDGVYTKYLDADEARAMAAALLQAADELDGLPPPPPPTFAYTTSGVSAVVRVSDPW